MKKLILIDAHAIIHRAYHALPPLTAPSGEPVNAVYGFTTILLRILREFKPDYIAAAFDLPGPTFRHIAYERYKAQRPETPSDLSSQFEKVKEVLGAFGVLVFEKEGYEADDIIGTIAKKLEKKKNTEIIIVTGDADALQLVRPGLKVYSMRKGVSDTVIYDKKAVVERYGFKPEQLIDFKGLKGDPSDNIPGVKGIGEKTATELIKTFGTIEALYKAVKKGTKKISSAVLERLKQGEEDAKFSKELATINQKVPIEVALEKMKLHGQARSISQFTPKPASLTVERNPAPKITVHPRASPWSSGAWTKCGKENKAKISEVFQKFGFTSLLKRLAGEQKEQEIKKPQPLFVESPSARAEFFSPAEFEKLGTKRIGLVLYDGKLFLVDEGTKKNWLVDEKTMQEKRTKDFFEEKKFLVHDGKNIIHYLRGFGIELGKIEFDIMIAAYLVESGRRDFSFLGVASRELGRMISSDVREELIHFFEIVDSLQEKIGQNDLDFVFSKIETPLTGVLARMEENGILIDALFLGKFSERIDADLKKLAEDIYKLAGEEFNINSPKQLSEILFEKLKIETKGLRKTEKGGVVSTQESELEKLKKNNPIIEKILNWRELVKLKTTYVDVLPQLVNRKTGRLHTTFNQTVTATGRLSSSNPNLQNIPIMSEYGRAIRKAFVAETGFLLTSFDYSQIELRVAAYLADDKKMIDAFLRGMDIHKMTASEVYNVPLEKVTSDLRRAAKTLNFGVLYGMGSQVFSEATGIPKSDAKKFIDEYFRDFAGIRQYLDSTKIFAQENGYVQTLFGRRRYLPEINSPNWQMRREAERMAINMPIQGTAADLVKLAMIKVDEWLKKEKLENDVKLLLQVHDELLFEIKESIIDTVAPKIKEIMEGVAELKVSLVVDVKSGKNWGEQNNFKI